jgi:GTP pyrophosphokinase
VSKLVTLDELVEKARRYNPEADAALIQRAYEFASAAHEGQRRRSGDPYVVHPVGVAVLIEELRLDVPSICAGLLHDSVEDTATSLEELSRKFSEEISYLVDGVTKLGKIPWNTREERQAENFRKMLLAMARDIRVILIKLADRTDNMRTLEFMPPDRQEAIARETIDIYAPLANRLGIFWIKTELEDLSFRYLYPEEYQKLVKALAVHDRDRRKYIEEVEGVLRQVLGENSVEGHVNGRFKNLWGIFSKMRRTERDLEQIHDVVAFRIITQNIRDCYAALGVVHENFTPIPGRFKDYVAMPKPNQYQSLHTSVIGPRGERMEVQIRTEEMHRVAEEGIAAHWVYKEGKSSLSTDDQKKFSWLRQLVEFQKDLKDPAEFLNAVKIDLFADEVYIFTPNGDVKAFPAGSTPIDFAYSIHSEVGDHCAGCRVNGLIVPLRYKLRNGDTVEIITSPHQKPSKDWLKFAITARARSKIRHFIRREQRERARTLGYEFLEREFRKHGHSLAKLQKRGDLQKAVNDLRLGSEEDLYMYVGFGRVTPPQVARAVLPEAPAAGAATPEVKRSRIGQLLDKVRRSPSGIRVQDVDDVLVRFAHCCNPVPGESIIGFITRGRGVTIHKVDCGKALDLDPERRIEVSWDADAKVEHPVAIEVTCTDKPGLLAEMSKAFSEQGVNISMANCRATGNARAVNTFHFNVFHLNHLKQVMRALQKIKGVHSVERV